MLWFRWFLSQILPLIFVSVFVFAGWLLYVNNYEDSDTRSQANNNKTVSHVKTGTNSVQKEVNTSNHAITQAIQNVAVTVNQAKKTIAGHSYNTEKPASIENKENTEKKILTEPLLDSGKQALNKRDEHPLNKITKPQTGYAQRDADMRNTYAQATPILP